MFPNFPVLALCALIPLVARFIWFQIFLVDEEIKINSKPEKTYQWLPFYVLSFLLTLGVYAVTIHQAHVFSLTGPDLETAKLGTTAAFLAEYGNEFINIQHGIAHGFGVAFLFFVFPVLGISFIFGKYNWKMFLIHSGYWVVTLIIMGAIIGKWGGILI